MRHLIYLFVTFALAVGCSSSTDPRIDKLQENAPAWTSTYEDKDLLGMLDRVCKGDLLEAEAKRAKTTDEEWGYMVGLGQSTCS